MALPALRRPDVQMAGHRPTPLPGVTVMRMATRGQLGRVVPHRFSTVLFLGGQAEWSWRSKRWPSAPGTIGLKVPGEVYVERARQGPSSFQVVVFEDALVDEARRELRRPLDLPRAQSFDGRDPRTRPIAALHRRLLDDTSSPAELEQELCTALAAFVELTSADRDERARASGAVLRARALLDERLTEPVTLDELAAHARLDKFRLCRAFRDEVGLPPHAYVTHRRVSLAQELLVGGMPQAEVAVRVGLYDQSQLHRHFKRILGVTPGAFVRALR